MYMTVKWELTSVEDHHCMIYIQCTTEVNWSREAYSMSPKHDRNENIWSTNLQLRILIKEYELTVAVYTTFLCVYIGYTGKWPIKYILV